MDDWIEIEGRTTKEAVERACIALNTTEPYLKYEVLESGAVKRIRAMKVEEMQERPDRREDRESREPREDRERRGFREARPRPRQEEGDSEVVEETETGRRARELLETMLRFIDEDVTVDLSERAEEVRLDIHGTEAGLFIGKYGRTLDSLQHLVSKMMAEGEDRPPKRVVLDSEQYRVRRREALEDLASQLARRALRERRPVQARPMNAMDRRTLHMALVDHPDVTTKSVGTGEDRKVVIVPRNSRSDDRSRRGGRRDEHRNGGRRTNGGGRGRGPRRASDGETRRRSGPPPRQHDSFDAPPEPADFLAEDPDAPMLDDAERVPDDYSDEEER